MNIKKLAAGALSAITAGATFGAVAFGALDTYVTTSASTMTSPMIVVPSYQGMTPPAGLAKDIAGAIDLGAHVAGYATETVSVSGSASSVTVSNGAGFDTPNKKLYLGDAINTAVQTLTSNDLPSVLASGTVTTSDGDFAYDQYIELGSSTIVFGKSAEDIDPVVHAQLGTAVGSPAYTIKIVFQKALNMTDTDTPGETIEIFGVDYTISSDSTNTKVILFGSGNTVTLTEGETTTATIGDTTYDLELIGVSDSDTAILKVNDDSDTIDQGSSQKIGGLTVYAKNVFYLGKETQVSSATFQLGSEKITLQNANEVKVGDSTTTSIDNTNVTITGTNEVSSIEVAVAAQDSEYDHVSTDMTYTDGVFGGFKFATGGATPSTDSEDTEMIEFGTNGDDDATVKFTDKSGNEKSFSFAHNVGGTLSLADTGADSIKVYEGANATEKEYIMVDSGDFGHIFEVTDITPADASDTGTVTLKDAFSGNSIEKIIPKSTSTFSWIIDGQTYYVKVYDDTTDQVQFTWGTGASAGNIGATLTIYPTLETSKGALVAITDNLAITDTIADAIGFDADADSVEFPGGETHNGSGTDISSGTIVTTTTAKVSYNVTLWNGTVGPTSDALTIGVGDPDATQALLTEPAIIILEEEDEDNEKNAVIVDTTYDSTNTEIEWARPSYTGSVGQSYDAITLETDTKVSTGRDEWGSVYTFDTDPDQPTAVVYYPDYEAFISLGIGADPTFSVGGSTGSVEQAVLITSPIAKLDSEVSTSTLASDLILVGGPCANTLVATIAEDNTTGVPACNAWTLSTGLIKEVEDVFSSGHKALVIAGTTADDTRSLAAKVLQGTLTFEE